MALELELTRETVASGAATMVITDSTGNYDATTNITGYGSPNAARNTLALILRIKNKRYDGESDISDNLLVLAAYDPTTVTQWTATLNKDGWQNAVVYGLSLYSTATLFTVNELVYDDATDAIWRIDSVSGSGPYTYTTTVMTEADLEDDDYTMAYSTELDTYAIPSVSECANKAIKKYFDDKTDSEKTSAEKAESKEDAEEIDLSITAIIYGFEHLYMAETQKQVEALENVCTCFTDNCPTC